MASYTKYLACGAGALAHCLQCRTACKIHNGPKMANGVWKGVYSQVLGCSRQPLLNKFLAATSSPRSDDITFLACLFVCHLIFLAVNFASLHLCPLHLCPFAPLHLCTFALCTFAPLHFGTLAPCHLGTLSK